MKKNRENPTIPFEVGASIANPKCPKVPSTKKCVKLIRDVIAHQTQEYVVVITASPTYEVLNIRIVGIGHIDRVYISPRDAMRGAVVDGAYGIVIIHNHPCGGVHESPADKKFARRLKKAGKILDVKLLDNIIVHKKKFVSVI